MCDDHSTERSQSLSFTAARLFLLLSRFFCHLSLVFYLFLVVESSGLACCCLFRTRFCGYSLRAVSYWLVASCYLMRCGKPARWAGIKRNTAARLFMLFCFPDSGGCTVDQSPMGRVRRVL